MWNFRIKSCIAIGALLLSIEANAQIFSEQDLSYLFQSKESKNELNYASAKHQSSSTLRIFLNGLFSGYKKFVSSQDASSCSFHPSCSVYFMGATKAHGMIKGGLLFGDRFQRCNSLSKENYPVYKNTKLLYDPVPVSADNGQPISE